MNCEMDQSKQPLLGEEPRDIEAYGSPREKVVKPEPGGKLLAPLLICVFFAQTSC